MDQSKTKSTVISPKGKKVRHLKIVPHDGMNPFTGKEAKTITTGRSAKGKIRAIGIAGSKTMLATDETSIGAFALNFLINECGCRVYKGKQRLSIGD